MKIQFNIEQQNYTADLAQENSIAISLLPNGDQPSHFGAPACTSEALESGSFIGDTQRGGSCNVNILTIIPHCNGTHTESISHIVNEKIPVYQAIKNSVFPAVLISVVPASGKNCQENYLPECDDSNRVITRAQLESKLASYVDAQLVGLAIRSQPNSTSKRTSNYDNDNYPVYLTNDAMTYLVERKIQHLMVDFPSVDKMYDDGLLSNHRIFWNVPFAEKQIREDAFTHKTITEMIYVDDSISDGFYLCNLQVPEIASDAVPSRPILYRLTQQD